MESQKVEVVYWRDRIKGKIESKEIDIEPYGYQLSPFAEWRIIVANEDKKVEASKVTVVDIEPVDIPENTVVSPLPIMRHALGILLDIYSPEGLKKVEESKKITQAIFLPVFDGTIKKGELLGVINIRYVKTRSINKIADILSKWVDSVGWAEDVGGIRLGDVK
jgi:hypothetical protein